MSFIYKTEPETQPQTPKASACCDADAAIESGPCCDPETGATTIDPSKLCCDAAAEKAAEAPKSSSCCG